MSITRCEADEFCRAVIAMESAPIPTRKQSTITLFISTSATTIVRRTDFYDLPIPEPCLTGQHFRAILPHRGDDLKSRVVAAVAERTAIQEDKQRIHGIRR